MKEADQCTLRMPTNGEFSGLDICSRRKGEIGGSVSNHANEIALCTRVPPEDEQRGLTSAFVGRDMEERSWPHA